MKPVVHFEMPAVDKARVSTFYSNVFGWHMAQMGPELGSYLMATTTESNEKGPINPGAINGGFFDRQENELNNAPHIVISVDNIDESIKAVNDAGGKVMGEKMRIPNVGFYVSFKDTEGNVVGMLQPTMPIEASGLTK